MHALSQPTLNLLGFTPNIIVVGDNLNQFFKSFRFFLSSHSRLVARHKLKSYTMSDITQQQSSSRGKLEKSQHNTHLWRPGMCQWRKWLFHSCHVSTIENEWDTTEGEWMNDTDMKYSTQHKNRETLWIWNVEWRALLRRRRQEEVESFHVNDHRLLFAKCNVNFASTMSPQCRRQRKLSRVIKFP